MNSSLTLLALLLVLTPPAVAAEPTALDAGIEHRLVADAATDPAAARTAYEAAVSAFLTHVARHPDDHTARWYLADTQHKLGRYDEALAHYSVLLEEPHNHAYADGAVFQRMRTALHRLHATHGGPEASPTSAVINTTPGGQPVYALSDDHLAYIEAADAVLQWTFPPSDPYGEARDTNRPGIAYITGQILFHHHHFDEARLRLLDVIETHPRSIEASYSAALLVDSYVLEHGLAKVRLYTQEFLASPVGPPDTQSHTYQAMEHVLEAAEFKTCLATLEATDHSAAIDCFLSYGDHFPESEHAALALYNAAHSAQLAGDPRTTSLQRRFVATYPLHELAPQVQVRLDTSEP